MDQGIGVKYIASQSKTCQAGEKEKIQGCR
jgi:hypothetical protein